MEHVVIGIEGLVGAGKTSICRELIKILPNTILLNGGNLYRAIVYVMMKSGANLDKLKAQAKEIDIKTIILRGDSVHHKVHAGLRLVTFLLSQSPSCWDYIVHRTTPDTLGITLCTTPPRHAWPFLHLCS